MILTNFKKRRAVSEVISTLLVLVITMVGAVFVSTMLQDTMGTAMDQTPDVDIFPNSVLLSGYDTRDSSGLSEITLLNNNFDQVLCTVTCQPNADNIPTSLFGNGTEFIIVQIRNENIESIYLQNIIVNNVDHIWDSQTSGKQLDLTFDDYSGNYPLNGKFSIIPSTNSVSLIQRDTYEIAGGEEVRILIKLSGLITPDLSISKPIKLNLNVGAKEPTEFFILAGDTR